ncbi:MAG: hypothetical protein KC731_33565, partial [Myxococcales bacterium]|nr:hypothetical protein [Myxococcales bacterium]
AAPALTPPVTSTPATTSRAEGPASHRALWIALAAASILVVGLVATLVWVLLREDDRPSPSSSLPCTYEICDESTRLDFDRPVELGHYLPQAERMAKSSEPKAELVSASITGVVDRGLRRSVGAAVSFSFQYDHGGESGSLVVTVNSSQTILARTISAARVPVVGHTLGDCDFQAALDAAEEAGLQRAKVLQVTYVTQGPQPMWLFQTEEPRDVRYVVGKACHAQATL